MSINLKLHNLQPKEISSNQKLGEFKDNLKLLLMKGLYNLDYFNSDVEIEIEEYAGTFEE